MQYVIVFKNAKTYLFIRLASRGAGISIIGGADIHIFVFCPINFF
jgi:hypothetical protein